MPVSHLSAFLLLTQSILVHILLNGVAGCHLFYLGDAALVLSVLNSLTGKKIKHDYLCDSKRKIPAAKV